ncbi:hypothetical protein [Jejubacter sp. L23]|uniref:hypothetical protein n=1 Tax=Jejubacter sp. L23 TaxID=3092086 RepID=UPI003D74267E
MSTTRIVSKPVDYVFVVDTSPGMEEAAKALVTQVRQTIAQAREKGCVIREKYLGIEGIFPDLGITQTVRDYLTKAGAPEDKLKARTRADKLLYAGEQEDIAPSVDDISNWFDWNPGADRRIMVLGNESLFGGGLKVGSGQRIAREEAVAAAKANNVMVSSYLSAPGEGQKYADGDAEKMKSEYRRLAEETGGESYTWDDDIAKLGEVLEKSISLETVDDETVASNTGVMGYMKFGTVQLDSDQASALNGIETFTRVKFQHPFPTGSRVVVFAQTNTFNGPDTPGIRIADVTPEGFSVRINELVAKGSPVSDGTHTQETVAWFASLEGEYGGAASAGASQKEPQKHLLNYSNYAVQAPIPNVHQDQGMKVTWSGNGSGRGYDPGNGVGNFLYDPNLSGSLTVEFDAPASSFSIMLHGLNSGQKVNYYDTRGELIASNAIPANVEFQDVSYTAPDGRAISKAEIVIQNELSGVTYNNVTYYS